jgi:hypothetical protein
MEEEKRKNLAIHALKSILESHGFYTALEEIEEIYEELKELYRLS